MKLQDINRKRLWILLTVLWCIGVVVYFYEPIKKEIKYNNNRLSNIKKLAQKDTFEQCLSDNGTSYHALVKNNSDRCKKQDCKSARGMRLFSCGSGLTYKICIASSSEECKHIYVHTSQKESKYYDYKKAEIIKRSKSISYPQQLTALLLFFSVPLLFAVFPRIISLLVSLKKWLISK